MEVPYNPVPTASPQAPGAARIRVHTPEVAFGGAVAGAVEGLGTSLEHVGTELFDRAIALKDMQNHIEADNLLNQFDKQSVPLRTQFESLKGIDASNGLEKHLNDMDSLRDSIGSQASNSKVAQMYRTQSQGFLNRNYYSSGGHAGQELKQANIDASKARTDQQVTNAKYARDDADFEQVLGNIANSVRNTFHDSLGSEPDKVANEIFKAQSAARAERISNISMTEPQRAQKMFDEAIKDHNLEPKDADRLEARIHHELTTTGARVIAREIIDGAQNYKDFYSDRIVGKGVHLDGVHPEFARRLHDAIDDAEKATGSSAKIESMHRSTQEQAEIYERYKRGLVAVAAPPGTSKHELGMAADLQNGPVLNWLHEHAKDYGLEFLPGKAGVNDPGHIQMSGEAPIKKPKELVLDEEDLAARARTKAQAIAPNDTDFHEAAVQKTIADFRQINEFRRNRDFNNTTIASDYIVSNPGGKPIISLDQLKQNPTAYSAFNALPEQKQQQIIRAIRANAMTPELERRLYDISDEGMRQYDKFRGMMNSDEGRKEFLDHDFVSEKFSSPIRREFINQQKKLAEKAEDDPRVTYAMEVLKQANILRGEDLDQRSKDPDRYDEFTGSLQVAMELWQAQNGRPPKAEDIRQIGTNLLQKVTDPTSWFGSQIHQYEKDPIPAEVRQKLKSSKTWGDVEPTEIQLRQAYFRMVLQQAQAKRMPDAQ